MLELGWSEILVIAIVLIVVVGPKDLPRVLRSFGRTTSKLRAMAGDFRRQFDEALREAELEDVKSLVDDVKKLDPRAEIRKHLSPLEEAGRDIRSGLNEATKAMPPVAGATPAVSKPAEPLTNGAVPPGPASPPVPTAPAPPVMAEAAPAPTAEAEAPQQAEPQKAGKTPRASAAKTLAKKPASAPAKKPTPRKKKTTGTAP